MRMHPFTLSETPISPPNASAVAGLGGRDQGPAVRAALDP